MANGRVALWCCLAGLAGCHGDPGQTAASVGAQHPAAPLVQKRGPSPDELTTGMVEAVTVGRSSVPVAVKFDLSQRPVVGQPVEVSIAVMPQIAADKAGLSITASPGLQLAPGAAPVDLSAVEPMQVYRHVARLTPVAEGVQLLGLSVSLQHDDITETRSFSVPLIVAAGSP